MTTPGFMPDNWFRELTPDEEEQFRQWARENFDPGTPASPLWHPVVRDEWAKLANEPTDSAGRPIYLREEARDA